MSNQKPAMPIQGGPGVPPPGAPHEVTKPLSGEVIAQMKQKAASNEQTLKPLPPVPKGAPTLEELKSGVTKGASLKPSAAEVVAVAEAQNEPIPDSQPPTSPDGLNEPEPAGETIETIESVVAGAFQPAASDSDSPSKGLPKPAVRGKEITGGWGEAGGGQYYALDGSELRTVVEALIKDLQARLATDLHFSIALAYPQVRCRVKIEIDGATADAGINDAKFDLEETTVLHLTATVSDTQETPADMIRDDHQIKKPFKRLVHAGAGKMFADVEVGS